MRLQSPRLIIVTHRWLLLLLGCLCSTGIHAEKVVVAVAANFAEVVEHLGEDFASRSPHHVDLSVGSTGALYAQIRNGAPFDVLLAADRRRPELLESEGFAVPGSRFTYAVGQLVLWSPEAGRVAADGAETLRAGNFRKLAMANPALAPYGLAARQTLEHLGLYPALANKIVMGMNIGQAHAMVATGNAEVGFVALSYLESDRNRQVGSRWEVPAELHDPIRQDAVLLTRAPRPDAGAAFLAYLRSERARTLIESFGYATLAESP